MLLSSGSLPKFPGALDFGRHNSDLACLPFGRYNTRATPAADLALARERQKELER